MLKAQGPIDPPLTKMQLSVSSMTASASPLTIPSCPQHSPHRRHRQIAFEFGCIGGRNNCGVARRGRVVAVVEAVSDSGRSSGNNVGADFEVPFPTDYTELLEQAKEATESALKDEKQLMEIEFPTSGLGSVPGDGEGGTEMTGSMQLIREFCDRFVTPEKVTRTRIFFPEASEVKVARKSAFEGVSFKLDYLTKPSFFQDLGFFTKVKMSDRVKPEDELFLVAYPYFNVDEMLVVEELYKEAVTNTGRKLIIFNGELDRIRSGCILFACNHDAPHKTIFPTLYISATLLPEFGRISLHKSQLFIYFASPTTLLSLKAELDYPPFFYPKLEALSQNLFPKMETVYYIHDFKGQNGGTLFRCYPGPWKVLRKFGNKRTCIHQQDTMPSLKEVALNILPSS